MAQASAGTLPEVVVCGTLVADVRVRPFSPVQPGTPGGLHHVDEIALVAGGLVSNSGLALARLGVPVAGLGRLGADRIGDVIAAELAGGGMLIGGIARSHDAATDTVVVCVDTQGERTFHLAGGAGSRIDPSDLEGAMPLLRAARLIAIGYLSMLPRLDPHLPALLARLKAETGATLLLETAGPQQHARALLAACLPSVDIFFPSWAEARDLTGRETPHEAITDLARAAGPGVLGIKLGADGCLVRDGREIRQIPAYPTAVVDATGAGDIFLAGLIAALLHGLDTISACRIGNLAASLAIGTPHGIASLPTLASLIGRIAEPSGRDQGEV